MSSLRRERLMRGLPSLLRLTLSLAVIPWLLTVLFGGPLPDVSVFEAVSNSTRPDQVQIPGDALRELLGMACWLLWGLAAWVALAELFAMLWSRWITPSDYLYPLHRLYRADFHTLGQLIRNRRRLREPDPDPTELLGRAVRAAQGDQELGQLDLPPEGHSFTHTVSGAGRHRETLRQVAVMYFNDPALWRVIYDANENRIQPDGATISQTRGGIRQGWVLEIPISSAGFVGGVTA